MKVVRKPESKHIAVKNVPISALFLWDGEFFIRVDSSIFSKEMIEAVNVCNGIMVRIHRDNVCTIVEAEIVIK